MGTPFDVALGATQMIGFAFQAFQACIEAYKFCRTAQHIGSEGDFLRTRLQIEHFRLERWAERTGLAASNPDPRLNWEAIRNILRLQTTLLTSADSLKKKYGLNLPEVSSSNGQGDGDGKKVDGKEKEKDVRGLERVLRAALHRTNPKLSLDNDSAKAIADANNPIKRLHWAAAGREKVVKVIDDLASLNSELERLLDHAEAQWLRAGLSTLLREVVSGSTSLSEVEDAQRLLSAGPYAGEAAIAAAADFKRIRLVAGVDKREDEIRPRDQNLKGSMPALVQLEEKKLRQAAEFQQNRRGLQPATYSDRPVFVEWRIAPDQSKFTALEKHMRRLALLLGNADISFSTLHCIGLLVLPKQSRFGFVYETPNQSPTEYSSLQDLISSHRKVCLRRRLSIACAIAETVLQLHTAGWLHKSIRSENIIFISEKDSDLLATQPYLIGFDNSRPSTAAELTETPNEPLHTGIYRHPEKRGPSTSTYQKRHDLYALGCLLMEIALWEDLRDSCSRLAGGGKDWRLAVEKAEGTNTDLKLPSLLDWRDSKSLKEELDHVVGPQYREAVQLCFVKSETARDRFDVSLEIQTEVVRMLRECKV